MIVQVLKNGWNACSGPLKLLKCYFRSIRMVPMLVQVPGKVEMLVHVFQVLDNSSNVTSCTWKG